MPDEIEEIDEAIEMDAMYVAWTIIANARDWLLNDPQSVEWRAAAMRWRDETFHPMLDAHNSAAAVVGGTPDAT